MKTNKKSHFITALLALSVMLVGAFSASAQPGPGGGGGFGGGRGGAFADATPEQQEAQQSLMAAVADLQASRAEAQTALNEAIYADTLDEANVTAKAAALAKIDADIALATAKAYAKVATTFTTEQKEALKAGRGGRGGRGGFGGGGRGGAGRGGAPGQ